MIRKLLTALAATICALVLTVGTAAASPAPPTNGGSSNGGGASGQCTGPADERPASCQSP